MTGETLSFLTQISGTWDRSVNKCFYTLVHHCWITSYKCSSKRHNREISDREELENSISIYSSVYETQLNWRLFSGWQRIYQPSNHWTLTLQSLLMFKRRSVKSEQLMNCVWSSLSVIQHCVSPTSDRIYSRCSTRILWALGTVTQAEIDWVCASPSGLTFITEHQDSCYSLFCDSSTNDYWVVNLSKVSCKNDSIKISFCEFPKVIVCLKLLIYVL